MVSPERPWQPYPEVIAETPLGEIAVEVFQPNRHHVVMGAGGKVDLEVDLEAMRVHGVPLYKRKGGGGTVLLGPETIVVTIHAGVAHTFHNLAYFEAINDALIACFRGWRALDYRQRGISDIAVDDRKIVGSSIFRRRGYLLYQASILVELELASMRLFLRHPPRQPDYRKNRSHADFLTSLRALGIDRSVPAMIEDLRRNLPDLLEPRLRAVDRSS